MRLMNKDFQKVETVYEAAGRLTEAGIRPSFNMIFGFPGEEEEDRRDSIRMIMDICRRFPGAEFWTNIFTPYPGAPIMQRAFELGIEVPKTLEGWADFFPRYTVLPWLKGGRHSELQTMREYLRLAFHRVPIGLRKTSRVERIVHGMIGVTARWRLDHGYYSYPVDLKFKQWAARLLAPPKPKVDAQRLESEVVTC
jgi:anaerobic magnesium-protoporphyrin IX monomethyl ester cyclase